MSQMSMEEEKEPVRGDLDRVPPDGLPKLDDDDAPAVDDGFVRPAAAPRSLAQTIQDRKFEASLYRDPEPEAVAQAVGKKASRSKFMDGAADVIDWASKGVGLVKEADDTAVLYGKDIPDVMEAAGNQFGGLREGADAALEGYAPVQEAFQGIGAWTDQANKALNPLPKISLGKVGGKDIKLGVGTKEILGAASGAMRIAQFHKNEGADPNATAIPERAAVDATQKEFRRALEARRRVGHLLEKAGGYADATSTAMSPESTEDGRVQRLLLAEKKRANLVALQKGVRTALRAGELGKAQAKQGVRSNNEYSMEKTAYLNDKEFVPRNPVGFFDKPDADKWSPKKGMIKDGDFVKASDYIEASRPAYERYAKQGAVKGEELPEGLMPGMKDNAGLEALPDDYRDDIEGGRSKQKQVAAARFLGGAGELFEGKLNTDRLVRDGRYGAAYGAKLAELGVITGTKAGAGAAQAGLIAATGGVAAPLIAAAEAGKHLAFHAKEQVGMGMQSASEGLEKLIDPQGLAKEQDNRDLYNKHFGLQKPAGDAPVEQPADEAPANDAPAMDAPANDPVIEQPASDAPSQSQDDPPPVHPLFAAAPEPQPIAGGYDELEAIRNKKYEFFGMTREQFQQVQEQRGVPDAQPMPAPEQEQEQVAEAQEEQQALAESAPTYEQMTADPSARAADIRERGIHWEKQGDRSIVGRQKRTWARAGKDILWGGAKKVAKGLWGGLTGLVTLPIHAAKWGWKGAKMAGRGLAAAGRGIASLFSRKKAAEPANKAREALTAMEQHAEKYKDTAELDRPQLKVDRLKDLDDLGDLSDEEKVRFRQLREKHAEVYGQRDEFGDEPGRVGGSRQAAKAALMAKPEVKRAEETAALREQFAPGKYTPRMESGELLDILRSRARADLEAEDQRPGGGGDGGSGPGGSGPGGSGPGGGGSQGDLLDQISQLEGDQGSRPERVAGSVPVDPTPSGAQQDFGPGGRPPVTADERNRQRDSYEESPEEIRKLQEEIAKIERRAARRQKKAQARGMIQPAGVRVEQREVASNRKFKNALFDEDAPSVEKKPAEPQKQAQEPGVAPTSGQPGGQEVRAKRQDSYGRRVEEWQAKADAAGIGLIMDPEDPWLQANPFPAYRPNLPHFDENEDYNLPVDAGGSPAKSMESQGKKSASVGNAPPSGNVPVMKQVGDDVNPALGGGAGPMMRHRGANGAWEYREEEQKGVGPLPLAGQARIPREQDVPAQDPLPQVPSSASRPEYLDTSAGGLRRDQRLMDPRDLALLANSANPARAQAQLPAIQEAVKRAQAAETTEAATNAWQEVDKLQKGVVNRRWSGYRPSDPASVRAADARTESRRDLMGERMIDVSTSHDGLDLPSAQVPDRRLDMGGDDQFRLPDFEMPGDDFNMFKNRDEAARLGDDMYDHPVGYLPRGVEEHGEEEIRKKLFKAYRTMPARRKQLQARFLDRQREAAAGIDFGAKRVMDDSGSPTADAVAHGGEITVDQRPVYPQVPNLHVDANQEFGGAWRRMDTDQVVQTAGLYGAGGRMGAFKVPVDGRNQFGEFHNAPIAEDRVLQAPAEGWDAEPRKPGFFARDRKQKKNDYRQAKQARSNVVAQAFASMKNDRRPGYIQRSAFGRQEWDRLEAERKARHDALRMRLHHNQMPAFGNLLFGVVDGPKKDRKK